MQQFINALLFGVLGLVPFSVYADIDSGRTWLVDQQQADGSVVLAPEIVLPYQSTVETILALDPANPGSGFDRNLAEYIGGTCSISPKNCSRIKSSNFLSICSVGKV